MPSFPRQTGNRFGALIPPTIAGPGKPLGLPSFDPGRKRSAYRLAMILGTANTAAFYTAISILLDHLSSFGLRLVSIVVDATGVGWVTLTGQVSPSQLDHVGLVEVG